MDEDTICLTMNQKSKVDAFTLKILLYWAIFRMQAQKSRDFLSSDTDSVVFS
jgi:hypothetical protein